MSESSLLQPEVALSSIGQRLDYVRGFVQRRYVAMLVGLLLVLPYGAFKAFTSPETYTAVSTMMIETRKGPLDQPGQAVTLDTAWFDTHLQNLKSLNVLGYVVKQLNLADDPEFLRSDGGPLDRVLARLGWSAPTLKTDAERTARAVELVGAGLRAQRVGQSYMIRVEFDGRNPDLGAKIANEMVNAYIFDQMNAKYQSSRRAGDWLQERLQTLRDQAASAERAVVQFKAKNNIVAAGGTTINEQQLTEISGELGKVRARVGDLQARIERMDAVRQAYQREYSPDQRGSAVDENFSEAMSNPIIGPLRAKYLELVNREADWASRYGASHVAVVNLRNQIRDIRRSIYDELGRIEETTRGELDISKKRQTELEASLTSAVTKAQDTNQAAVTLFSLEAAAKSYRSLYDNFLRQHTEAVQEQTYPISDARLISSASVVQTGPQKMKIWLFTALGGALFGIGFGALRELLDRGFRTTQQVKSVLNVECLGLIPRLHQGADARKGLAYHRAKQMVMRPKLLGTSTLAPSRKNDAQGRSQILWAAVDAPNSAYADAIRSLKLSLDTGPDAGCSVIGLTSHLPTEGKSTIAAGVASQMAQGGRRVILIDCDVRNPSLSRALVPDAKIGFLDVVVGEAEWGRAVRHDADTGLSFLPMVPKKNLRNPTELLASREARLLIDSLKSNYDHIIIDMAPLISTVDVLAVSRFVQSYVLVIEWGTTKMEAVRHALSNTPAVQMKMLGAVLNKVDFASLGRYEAHGSYHHYYYGQSGSPQAQ